MGGGDGGFRGRVGMYIYIYTTVVIPYCQADHRCRGPATLGQTRCHRTDGSARATPQAPADLTPPVTDQQHHTTKHNQTNPGGLRLPRHHRRRGAGNVQDGPHGPLSHGRPRGDPHIVDTVPTKPPHPIPKGRAGGKQKFRDTRNFKSRATRSPPPPGEETGGPPGTIYLL